MRTSGLTDQGSGFGLRDHVCWTYDDRFEFVTAMRAFLAEGVQLGQRIGYVGAAPTDALRADLEDLDGIDELLATGACSVISLGDIYREGTPEPVAQVGAYAAQTQDALAAGFTGLRVAADATELVLAPGAGDRFLQYEHLIDRAMASGLPFAAMCGYDAERVARDRLAELAFVHPLAHATAAPFSLHAGERALLALRGEIDAMWVADLERVLARVLHDLPGPLVQIDCTDLRFLDHRAVAALDEAAARSGVELWLVDPPVAARRVLDLFPARSIVTSR